MNSLPNIEEEKSSPVGLPREFWLVFGGCGFALLSLILFFPFSPGYEAAEQTLGQHLRRLYFSDAGEWLHCMFVPFIVLVILVWKQKEIATGSFQPEYLLGILAMSLSAIVFWGGYKANEHYVGFAAIHMFIASFVLYFAGWHGIRKGFFFLAFLVFAWPLAVFNETISFNLKYAISSFTSDFLNMIGVGNHQMGSAIVSLPDEAAGLKTGEYFSLEVDAACSGIRSLFALMMISSVYGFVMHEKAWQRWTIFLSAIPFAMFGNFVRILILLIGSVTLGSDIAIGPDGHPSAFHMMAGFLVFFVALGAMLFLSLFLHKGMKAFQIRKKKIIRTANLPGKPAATGSSTN